MRVTSAGTVRDVAPVSEMHVSSHQSTGQVATAPAAAAPALEQGESFDNAAIAEQKDQARQQGQAAQAQQARPGATGPLPMTHGHVQHPQQRAGLHAETNPVFRCS